MSRPTPFRRQALAAAALLALASSAVPASAQTWHWAGGTFAPGVTAPATLTPLQVLDIDSGGFKYFDTASGTFTNGGTVNWNADALYLQGSAAIVNDGLWDSKVDQTLVYNGGAPSFANHGTFRKSGGTGATTIQAGLGFVNDGVLDAASGVLDFVGGSVFDAGTRFIGAGINRASGGNVFNGSFSSTNLQITGGTQTGTAAVLNGSASFAGGTLAGTWSIAAGATLAIADGGFKYIDGATTRVTNAGTVAWNADTLYLQGGAQVVNNGVWDSTVDQTLAYNGGAPSFANHAIFRKSGGSGATTIQAGLGFVNDGTLDAASGVLNFVGGSSFNAGTRFIGAGVNRSSGDNAFNGSFTSSNLQISAGTQAGNGAVLNGSASFAGGVLAGTWTVAAGATLAVDGGGFKYVSGSGTVATNSGQVSWNADTLYVQQGARIVNLGVWTSNTDQTLAFNGGSGNAFVNDGILRKAGGSGSTTVQDGVGFVNNGQIDAAVGTIDFVGGSTFDDGSVFSGAGQVRMTGTNRFAGTQNASNLVLAGGSFHDGSAASINGLVTFEAGHFGGTWTVNPGQTLRAVDGGFKYLTGAGTVLTNAGTFAWNSANTLYLEQGATLANRGLFVANAGMALANNGGAQPVFDNTGTLRAAAGTVLTVGSVLVNNGGTLDAEAGAAIRVTGGSVFNAGSVFSGAGSTIAAGSNAFNGGYTSANLVLESGIHGGTDAVAGGSTRFTGGVLAGTWQVAAGSTLTAGDGGFKYVSGAGSVLDNRGTINWATSNALYIQQGASVVNAGTLDLQADAVIAYNGGAASFVNTGLIVKSGGSGSAAIQNNLGFDNQGTIAVRSGTLALPTDFTNHGTLTGNATFGVSGTLANEGRVDPGATPATLALQGSFAQAAAGTLAIDLLSLAQHDLLTISGSAALGGTLALGCWGDCHLAVGDVVTILDAAGPLSGSFASVTLAGFATGAFDVVYDTADDLVQLRVTQAVTALPVPEPSTWALWLAGAAAMGAIARRRRAAR